MRLCFSKDFKWIIGLVLIVLIGTGCGKANVQVYHDVEANWDYPRTVAILPFTHDSEIIENKNPHIILREVFFNYFSYLGYTDLPLNIVDLKPGQCRVIRCAVCWIRSKGKSNYHFVTNIIVKLEHNILPVLLPAPAG